MQDTLIPNGLPVCTGRRAAGVRIQPACTCARMQMLLCCLQLLGCCTWAPFFAYLQQKETLFDMVRLLTGFVFQVSEPGRPCRSNRSITTVNLTQTGCTQLIVTPHPMLHHHTIREHPAFDLQRPCLRVPYLDVVCGFVPIRMILNSRIQRAAFTS